MSTTTEGPYAGKRLFDLAVIAVVAIPALILGSICALAVRITSRGPVFFRQERVGMRGETFMSTRISEHLNRWATANPDPYRGVHWP